MGLMLGDQVHHYCELVHGPKRVSLDPGEPVSTIVPLLVDWLGFLRGEQPNPVPGEEGLAAIRVCDACVRSAAQGNWEKV
jgi:predicted dehydrogenase